MRVRLRSVVTTAALSLLGSSLTIPASHAATSAVFGYGTPAFVASASNVKVPLTPVLEADPDLAGEPSIGLNWNTGAGMFMAGTAVQKVTYNAGTSRVTWEDASPVFGTSQNLDPILATNPVSGVTIAGGDDGACSAMFSSTDDGGLWLPSIPCTGAADHPGISYAPSAVTPGATVWYYCQQTALDNCATSTDEGLTWVPGANLSLDCTYQHGHLRGGPDGFAYLPSNNCFDADSNNLIGGLRTNDDGLTWIGYTIPGATTPASGFDPAVAVTPDNTLYEAWDRAGDHHPVIAISRDHGDSWTQPVDLAGTVSPPLVASTFATLTSGDNGRVAYTFLGTSAGEPGANPFATGFHGVWYPYTSTTLDGGQTWTTVRATPTPLQYGEIDAGGTTTAGQRNLLDFIDSSVTKEGRVVVALADGCLADCEAAGDPNATVSSAYPTNATPQQLAAEAKSTHAWATVAYQSTGRGLFSAYDVTPVVAPSAPVLTGSTTTTGNTLSWSIPDNGGAPVTSYSVSRAIGSGPLAQVTTTTLPTYTDLSTAPGTYRYAVTATNSAGTSVSSNVLSLVRATVPGAPTTTATSGNSQVGLSWTTPADGGSAITGYRVLRGASPATLTPLASVAVVTSYVDTSATPGTTYSYAVSAVNSVGSGPASAAVSAMSTTVPGAAMLTTVGGKGTVSLSWSTPSDGYAPITSWTILRGVTPGSEVAVQTITTGTSYVDQALAEGTYYYRVVASNKNGAGAASNEASSTVRKGK